MATKKKSTKKKAPDPAPPKMPPGWEAHNFRFTTVKTQDAAQHLANQNAALRMLAAEMSAEIGRLRIDLAVARVFQTPHLESVWMKGKEET